MHTSTAKVIALMAVVLPTLSATAFADTDASQAPSNTTTVAASQCPAGTTYEAAGYVGSGKWRDAHCATGNGNE